MNPDVGKLTGSKFRGLKEYLTQVRQRQFNMKILNICIAFMNGNVIESFTLLPTEKSVVLTPISSNFIALLFRFPCNDGGVTVAAL
jgi:hypothetical protein